MKRILYTILILFSFITSSGQITFLGSESTPADAGTQAGPTVSVTPVASMVAGDLVLLVAGYKNGGVTFSISNDGGQTWTPEDQGGGSTSGVRIRLFWARFNGTWSADPSVTIGSGTLAMSVQMHVFRPTSGSNTWALARSTYIQDASSTSAMQPNTFIDIAAGELAFGCVISNDDNTYTNNSTGFTTAGNIQYRNQQGNDISMGAEYRIAAVSTVGSDFPYVRPSWTQATLGSDTYGIVYASFVEVSGSSKPRRVTLIH